MSWDVRGVAALVLVVNPSNAKGERGTFSDVQNKHPEVTSIIALRKSPSSAYPLPTPTPLPPAPDHILSPRSERIRGWLRHRSCCRLSVWSSLAMRPCGELRWARKRCRKSLPHGSGAVLPWHSSSRADWIGRCSAKFGAWSMSREQEVSALLNFLGACKP